ncbi:MAG: hypothetical protein QG641_1391, partial [Candidatus Poribacteria bacterium]|nr:hypothetical protein [Candidatus Poribacteria bacterium]
MDNTIIQQGTFTKADTSNVTLSLRSDIDWIKVYNRTQIGATNNVGVEFYWQREMIANGHGGFITAKYGGLDAVEMQNLAVGSFIPLNTSVVAPGAPRATTGTTNATQPVVSTATTTGLSDGSIVRLIDNTNQNNIAGFDFEIDTIAAGVSFRMAATLANAVGGACGNGFYRLIPYEPMFYPRWRTIVNITQAASAVVTASVRHCYTVGQEIRFVIPEAAWGMVELNGIVGTITAVTTLTFTV